MSFMEDIRYGREGYVRDNFGDKLIAIEAVIIGIAAGFLLYYKIGMSILQYIVIASIVAVAITWLVANIPIVAMIVGILFSLVWATVGFVVGSLIFDESIIAGILAAFGVFALSLFCHKVFAGIGFVSRMKYMDDSLDEINNNLKNINNMQEQQSAQPSIVLSVQPSFVQSAQPSLEKSEQPSLGQSEQPVLGQSEQPTLEQITQSSLVQPEVPVEIIKSTAQEEMVHICSSCGAQLRQEDVFCNKCGARQA